MYEAGDKGRLGAIHMRTQHNLITDQTMGRAFNPDQISRRFLRALYNDTFQWGCAWLER